MTFSTVPWWISAVWVSLTFVTFLAVDTSSLGFVASIVLVMTLGLIPPVVLLSLWSDGPPPTVAEVLHAAEGDQ